MQATKFVFGLQGRTLWDFFFPLSTFVPDKECSILCREILGLSRGI